MWVIVITKITIMIIDMPVVKRLADNDFRNSNICVFDTPYPGYVIDPSITKKKSMGANLFLASL